jgi:hypothetical protein
MAGITDYIKRVNNMSLDELRSEYKFYKSKCNSSTLQEPMSLRMTWMAKAAILRDKINNLSENL